MFDEEDWEEDEEEDESTLRAWARIEATHAETQDTDWKMSGDCLRPENQHLDWFGNTPQNRRECVAVCMSCPVRVKCAEYARNDYFTSRIYSVTPKDSGIWGGLWGGRDQVDLSYRKPIKKCKSGHAFTEANTQWSKDGKRSCKKCATIRQAKRRSMLDAYCKHGHKFTDESTYFTPKGYRQCLICRKIREGKQ